MSMYATQFYVTKRQRLERRKTPSQQSDILPSREKLSWNMQLWVKWHGYVILSKQDAFYLILTQYCKNKIKFTL